GRRGRKVVVVDHANKVGKKILMSGGGRCNFTNLYAQPDNFLSGNPHFCKSALSRFTQWDFLALVQKYQIPYHEKKAGQLFCDNKAQDILNLLLAECAEVNADIHTHCTIEKVAALPVADLSGLSGSDGADSGSLRQQHDPDGDAAQPAPGDVPGGKPRPLRPGL